MALIIKRPSAASLSEKGAGCPKDIEGRIHSTEIGGAVDGPGVRFVLFLAGCALRCQYCHNPDSWSLKNGRLTTASQIKDEIASYAHFLKRAGGGLTLSGGEPLVQPEFTKTILKAAKALGLHTAIDTSGFLGAQADDDLLADTDLVLLDIKAFSEKRYKEITGVNLQPTLSFARRLAAIKKPIWLRYVLVPGLTDNYNEIANLADFAATLGNVERVDVLPFHKMGEYKWKSLGLSYQLEKTQPPSEAQLAKVRQIFQDNGLKLS
ncbi:pyruvate formate-lyase-activating protein [Zymomonas mobilis]|uniref:Pyruvate formate-lyase-activating enzyme n=1 Tax=Zymomonas mobilis subsp. pomaceae (strain ATCC 29192 / DSM 22645 / JCM 10191 / CCUG 17912 / NBRC 13757 / NCIMB 11200 / NRRL B-4491 / Barker I) TaxID=579138 RepID=F8EW24_ZYMMT|nr:pyruvate formate-lyase-activating protein [Zymomonas mobilis]AEI38434.1 pyruvate formate-lyase activating enzyme [Zymomonas mobilis subsp. pomaceae ATCC 29192]MDX5948123.1 pyruvate formate-lyase-activating protein [Zymomonas mobilis subsp. pomaceae]GEB89766.1 pyruvate formate-lyase-activating enzyme [Zymomonas mobilis subsp. pomaceae]